MRRVLLLAVLTIVTTSGFHCMAAPAQAPVDVVRQGVALAYDHHAVQKFLSKGLRDDFDYVTALPDCNYWDADLFTGSQSQTAVKILRTHLVSETNDSAIVIATLRKFIEGEPVKPNDETFFLLKENGVWKIEEILISVEPATTTRVLPFAGTLHAYLHGMRARNCR